MINESTESTHPIFGIKPKFLEIKKINIKVGDSFSSELLD
tara:strand:- start:282 stop:401 length:120 start_codon:yes stop_codon:yes gene_type:complete